MSNKTAPEIRRRYLAQWSATLAIVALGFAAVIRLGSVALAVDDDATPTAEAVIEKYIEATGGRAAYGKIRNRVTKGHIEFVRIGVKASVETYEAPPNKQYSRFETDRLGEVEEGTDGAVAWHRSDAQGPQVRKGKQNEAALRDATFDRPLHWREVFKSAVYAGIETVGGKPAHKIALHPAIGEPEIWYFDKETYYLVRQESVVEPVPDAQVPLVVTHEDYRKVDGIMIPFLSTQTFQNGETRFVTETVEHNVDLPANRFALPDDVKELVKTTGAAKAEDVPPPAPDVE